MSRFQSSAFADGCGFPRVSGDEPVSLEDFQTAIEFSPRERG